ncbi:MAG: amidohydrolase family protein [Planctomycetota bacterium]
MVTKTESPPRAGHLAGGPSASEARQTIVDADVHFASDVEAIVRRMPQPYRKRGWLQPGGTGLANPVGFLRDDAVPPSGGRPGSDPGYMLEHHFEALGVRHGLLLPDNMLGMGISPDYRYADAAATAFNDYMLETWLDFAPAGDRFLGSLFVSHAWPEGAAKEIRRVGGEARMKQVVMTSATERPLGHVGYWPIYEAAEEMGLPVAVHPGAEGRGVTGAPTGAGWPSSYFEWHNGLSQNYMAQINSLVSEGVFQKFPGLRFVAVEGGYSWLAHLMWRMDKNWKALRETVPWLEEPPSEVIRRHVRLTTQPVEEPTKPEHLMQVFEMIHAEDVLMFSSDYPHWDFDDPYHAFPSKFNGALRDRVMFRNAAELYGLELD